MPVHVVDNLGDLRALQPRWRDLTLPTPMQSPAWLVSWWEAFGEQDHRARLAVPTVTNDQGELLGLLPLYVRDHPVVGPTLRLLGDGRSATDHTTVLCRTPEDEPGVVTAIAEWIASEAGNAWRRVRLENLDADDRATSELFRLLEEAGIDAEWVASVNSYPVALPEADEASESAEELWGAYLARLSKNRRKRLRRWQRDWFDTARAMVRVVHSEHEREEMWPLLVNLHGARRRAMGEQGVFDLPEFDQFHQKASARLLEEGRLYLALLELDGEPAAIEYALQDDVCMYAYQGGIDPNRLDDDAGHLSLMGMFGAAFEAGRSRMDLLRGEEPYKLSWGAEPRQSRTLHARPRDVAGGLERVASQTYRRLKAYKS